MARTTDRSVVRSAELRALAIFAIRLVLVGAVYGLFIGALGPNGILQYNQPQVRSLQARLILSAPGPVMLIWRLFEFGYLRVVVTRLSPPTRAFFAMQLTQTAIMGLLGRLLGSAVRSRSSASS